MNAANGALRSYVEEVLRPMIQVDGGDVVFDRMAGPNRIVLRLRGDCSRCGAAACRLVEWIADRIEDKFGVRFQIETVCDTPYFYR